MVFGSGGGIDMSVLREEVPVAGMIFCSSGQSERCFRRDCVCVFCVSCVVCHVCVMCVCVGVSLFVRVCTHCICFISNKTPLNRGTAATPLLCLSHEKVSTPLYPLLSGGLLSGNAPAQAAQPHAHMLPANSPAFIPTSLPSSQVD